MEIQTGMIIELSQPNDVKIPRIWIVALVDKGGEGLATDPKFCLENFETAFLPGCLLSKVCWRPATSSLSLSRSLTLPPPM